MNLNPFDEDEADDDIEDAPPSPIDYRILMDRLKGHPEWPEKARQFIGQSIRNHLFMGAVRPSDLEDVLEDLPLECPQVTPELWAEIQRAILPESYRDAILGMWATSTIPGTLDRIILLKRRLKAGFQLHHPEDERL